MGKTQISNVTWNVKGNYQPYTPESKAIKFKLANITNFTMDMPIQ